MKIYAFSTPLPSLNMIDMAISHARECLF